MTHTKYVSLIRHEEAAAPIKSFSSIHFFQAPKGGRAASRDGYFPLHWIQCSPHCFSLSCCCTDAFVTLMQYGQCLSYYLKLLFVLSSVIDTSSFCSWCQIVHTLTWMKSETPFCSDNPETAQVFQISAEALKAHHHCLFWAPGYRLLTLFVKVSWILLTMGFAILVEEKEHISLCGSFPFNRSSQCWCWWLV